MECVARGRPANPREREFFIDNLLVRIHFIVVMIRWTGLAPWEFESPFPTPLPHPYHPVGAASFHERLRGTNKEAKSMNRVAGEDGYRAPPAFLRVY